MIRLEHVQKDFGNEMPLVDVNAVIDQGDVVCIIGPSGIGKTTLLRCINLLDPPTGGRIYLEDEEITKPHTDLNAVRKRIGMVFQSFTLFPHMTVVENIMHPQMKLLGADQKTALKKSMELLKQVDLSEKALADPAELSGGQKQRVAIARTLAMDPEVILFDEPTSALDPTMVAEVLSVIENLANTGHTMIIVTHDMTFAKKVCNKIFFLAEGIIYEAGSPEEIFDHPQKELTKKFLKQNEKIKISSDDVSPDEISNEAETVHEK